MAIEVFNRFEKKYLIDENILKKMIPRLEEYMVLDQYTNGEDYYHISNIYYDTPDNRLIRKSIEKPIYKEKLRLRTYGIPSIKDCAYVEIKKKYKGVVNKRRTSMPLDLAYEYLNENIYPDFSKYNVNTQVLREIDYFKKFYNLVPKVYISYDRRAYFQKEDGDFRLTFDTNIITRRNDLRLERGVYGESILPEGYVLMEVKIYNAAPLWFTRLMSEFKIYPVSFSKYGTEYKHYIQNQTVKGKTLCFNQYLHQQTVQYQSVHQL